MSALVWTCEECSEPIDDAAGYVAVDYADIRRHLHGEREWEAELERQRAEAGTSWIALPLAELSDNPRARWRVLHGACDPRPESNDYWIGVERIRTPSDVLSWTAHLLGKNWIQATTWDELLRRIARATRDEVSTCVS